MLFIRRDVPLASFSTFKIGGSADFFAGVTTVPELTEALEYIEKNKLPLFVFSGGSNLLISDAGFRGMVIRMAGTAMRTEREDLYADAGAVLLDVVQLANAHGLAGIEKLAGIPGSLGGAIRGNAGAFGVEIGNVVAGVKVFDRKKGLVREYTKKQCEFSYRQSYFKEHPELIILSAQLRFREGDPVDLTRISDETMRTREATHPQDVKCAGSFFTNPVVQNKELHVEFTKDTGLPSKDEKLPAGWLIDHVGLRGKQIGGAQISPLHPNYLINTGSATAEQIVMLASLVKQRVRDELGVQLKEEVQFVGFH